VVEVKGESKNVLGTIAGGLLGGVLGHQVGGGTGKDLATVIGAVGGAYAGNRVENSRDTRKVFRVTVRLDGGSSQNFDYVDDPAVSVGTRVKVENGALIRL
jgi:outer membrane lipoprotein SlyB